MSDGSDSAVIAIIKAKIVPAGTPTKYKASAIVDILPMPKGRGFLDTNDTCLLK